MAKIKRTLEERFWSKVDRRGHDECWPWTGKHLQRGYGLIWDSGRNRMATHVAWELCHGKPFPEGMDGLHTCDWPFCVNPAHIFPGTHADNMRDMIAKRRGLIGEKNGQARLTEDTVRQIRAQIAAGAKQCDMARENGVSESTVSLIKLRRIWRYV